jgi:formate C-acetyltransferase
MFLTALDHIHMPDPNGALAVSSETSDEILRYAADILSHGVTHPAFFNDEVIVDSLQKYGCSREDAVNYIHTTCAEISVVGKTRSHTTPMQIDLPVILERCVERMGDGGDFEALKSLYVQAIEEQISKDSLRYVMRMLEASRNGNEPMRTSCLVSNCIQRGRSIYEGGERYSFLQPNLVGFATAVDSLVAIRELVYAEKSLAMTEFLRIVRSDFAYEEALRQRIVHKLPHYGNDYPTSDKMAKWLADSIAGIFQKSRLLAGKMMMPGTFSYVDHANLGAQCGATFDGRRKGFSYSDGCSPAQGRDVSGPTAMILSLTSWDQSAFLGGMVVNIKFTHEHLRGEQRDNFIAILRAFIERGGIEMQVNVVDRKTLQDAYEHPENYGNLVVRIGGYSDYFVRLSDALKLEIIKRTEY